MDSTRDQGAGRVVDTWPTFSPEDTNITATWPVFLLAALKRYRTETLLYTVLVFLPFIAAAIVLALMFPSFAVQTATLGLPAYAIASVLVERNVCRTVMVISPDQDRVNLDEQRWWRDDERQIPDAFKKEDENTRKRVAWIYRYENEWHPFSAWESEPEITKDTVTASNIAGIRTTMRAAGQLARHREPDGREMARYGLLALIILAGLLAIYLAGTRALDTF